MIDIKSLNLYYEKEHILKDINLEIKKGEFVLLNGVSGSGKTSLLTIIGALLKPSSGKVEVDGKLISKLPDLHLSKFRLETIGFIFQDFNLIESLSVKENILSSLIPLKLNKKEALSRTKSALKLANIEHKINSNIKDLSGGEKQRVAIARALVNSAPILLCDEPTANLDIANSIEFIELLKSLNSAGKTIIVSTHDSIFRENGDFRVINIRDGKIVSSDRVFEQVL